MDDSIEAPGAEGRREPNSNRSGRIALLIETTSSYAHISPDSTPSLDKLTTRTVCIAAVIAAHARAPHQPTSVGISHIRISINWNRDTIGVQRKTSTEGLNAPHTMVTRSRIDGAPNIAFGGKLVALIGAQIDLPR